jgi:NADH-quinone oxidoreductase subunit L
MRTATARSSFRELREHAHVLEGAMLWGVPSRRWRRSSSSSARPGKSAQIPLYVWLPDAMAGPTPVSALIHAATMVTAGVYMIGRLNFVFAMAPETLAVVATIGAATALLAATIALAQNDIKRVLAYSTVSQLGYMFLAMGVGAYAAGIFHLMTHAFFKACLFLGSGSVIHAMGGEQDMRKMGGLRKHLPGHVHHVHRRDARDRRASRRSPASSRRTRSSGRRSRRATKALWAIGLLVAGLTAFYMFRQVFMVFFGECRADHETQHHLHESPPS